jgi:hypothetical protein
VLLTLLAALVAGPASKPILPIRIGSELVHPYNLLVQYAPSSGVAGLKKIAGMSVLRDIPEIGFAVVTTSSGMLQRMHARLATSPAVMRVEYDKASRPAYVPNDPRWPDQWHTRALNVDTAWDTTKGDPGVTVAVIDTGVDATHPDLTANIYTNPGEVPENGIDDDGNGYIDDVQGWDFVNNDNLPADDYGHGTACAGLVAAVQDNNIGVTGVAPHCAIMPIKAANSAGYFYDSATVPAYIYAANMGVKVFSMSFFADHVTAAEEVAMNYAYAHGVLPVAAAGNDSTVYSYYPGAYENVLSVAALDTNLNKAGFSDFGSWVDVASPGVSLSTTTNGGGYTPGFAGTSGACPQVAGIAALCFSVNPSATPDQVRDAIEDTATLQNQAPFGEFSNYGLCNANAAVLRMLGGGAPVKPPVVRWVSNLRAGKKMPAGDRLSRIYGRGFGAPATLAVSSARSNLAVVGRGRDYIDVNLPVNNDPLEIKVDGNLIATVANPGANSYNAYPLAEASTQGATLQGGFFQTLAIDGQVMTCTRRGDGYIIVQGTFRRIPSVPTMNLNVTRMFSGSSVGTETIQLYDWSSASYPYGNFVTFRSGASPTSMATQAMTIPNFGRFVDDDGTVYFRLITSSDLSSDAVVSLDRVFLSPPLSH